MPSTDAPPLLGHHWKYGSSIASCYYSTLSHNVSLPVMRPDSIAQIAKALARLVPLVSPPFVTLNFIVEWSKTVRIQNALWRQRWGHGDLILTALFSSAVLQVWWTVCSSDLGYLISIHPLHHSLHSVEVTMRMFVLVLCLLPVVQVGCFFTA